MAAILTHEDRFTTRVTEAGYENLCLVSEWDEVKRSSRQLWVGIHHNGERLTVESDHSSYELTHYPDDGLYCPCPAGSNMKDCYHQRAARVALQWHGEQAEAHDRQLAALLD